MRPSGTRIICSFCHYLGPLVIKYEGDRLMVFIRVSLCQALIAKLSKVDKDKETVLGLGQS
jgi:hypothetical protein